MGFKIITMKRSEFINTFFRASLLVSLAALTGFFAAGRKIGPNADCNERSQCKACGKLNRCSLPEAVKYKNNG